MSRAESTQCQFERDDDRGKGRRTIVRRGDPSISTGGTNRQLFTVHIHEEGSRNKS